MFRIFYPTRPAYPYMRFPIQKSTKSLTVFQRAHRYSTRCDGSAKRSETYTMNSRKCRNLPSSEYSHFSSQKDGEREVRKIKDEHFTIHDYQTSDEAIKVQIIEKAIFSHDVELLEGILDFLDKKATYAVKRHMNKIITLIVRRSHDNIFFPSLIKYRDLFLRHYFFQKLIEESDEVYVLKALPVLVSAGMKPNKDEYPYLLEICMEKNPKCIFKLIEAFPDILEDYSSYQVNTCNFYRQMNIDMVDKALKMGLIPSRFERVKLLNSCIHDNRTDVFERLLESMPDFHIMDYLKGSRLNSCDSLHDGRNWALEKGNLRILKRFGEQKNFRFTERDLKDDIPIASLEYIVNHIQEHEYESEIRNYAPSNQRGRTLYRYLTERIHDYKSEGSYFENLRFIKSAETVLHFLQKNNIVIYL